MDVKNTHSVTETEISVFGRQALDAERRRSPSLADKVLIELSWIFFEFVQTFCWCFWHILLQSKAELYAECSFSQCCGFIFRVPPRCVRIGFNRGAALDQRNARKSRLLWDVNHVKSWLCGATRHNKLDFESNCRTRTRYNDSMQVVAGLCHTEV